MGLKITQLHVTGVIVRERRAPARKIAVGGTTHVTAIVEKKLLQSGFGGPTLTEIGSPLLYPQLLGSRMADPPGSDMASC